jgi:hypothetical protein
MSASLGRRAREPRQRGIVVACITLAVAALTSGAACHSGAPTDATCASMCSTNASCFNGLSIPIYIESPATRACSDSCEMFQEQCQQMHMVAPFQDVLNCFASVSCADADTPDLLRTTCSAELKSAYCFAAFYMSPPATEGPTITGITGTQGPTRWRGGGSSRCPIERRCARGEGARCVALRSAGSSPLRGGLGIRRGRFDSLSRARSAPRAP